MSIELDPITSGYNLSKINSNFQKIEDYTNDNLLHRASSVAGERKMEGDVDMDSNAILNLPAPTTPNSPVRVKDILDLNTDQSGLTLRIDLASSEEGKGASIVSLESGVSVQDFITGISKYKASSSTFEEGFTVEERNQIFKYNGVYYQFLGTLPLEVPAGSTPIKNIDGGEWLDVGDGSNAAYYGFLSAWGDEEDKTDVINGLILGNRDVIVDSDATVGMIKLQSNTNIKGINKNVTLTLIPPTEMINGLETANFYHAKGDGDIYRVSISNLTINGGRVSNPTLQYHHCFGVWVDAGETASDFRFKNIRFKNAGEDFIRFVACAATAKVSDVRVEGCHFETEGASIGLPGYASTSSQNAVRTITSYSPYAAYGVRTISGVKVLNCTAKNIRTLTDFKRGTYSSQSSGHNTEDMYDCHHSCDGTFGVNFSNMACFTNAGFTGGTATNFIEVQGEGNSVTNIHGIGNDVTKIGVLVTDYGLPAENGVGHQSVNCTLSNIRLENMNSDGIKVINGINNIVDDVAVKGCKGHAILFSSGSGRDATEGGSKLQGYNNTYDNVTGSGWTNPPKLEGNNNIRGLVINAQGHDEIYIPGVVLRAATNDYGAWRNKHKPANLIINPYFEFIAGSDTNLKWFDNTIAYDQVISATTTPTGIPVAVTLADTSTTSLREIKYTKVPAVQNDIFYARIWAKKGTAAAFGFTIHEQDSSGVQLGATYFYSTSMSTYTDWTEFVFEHKVINTSAKFLVVGILPAGGSNTPSLTGTTDVSFFRFGRNPFGLS